MSDKIPAAVGHDDRPCKTIILKLKICTVYGNLFHGQMALDCVTNQNNICLGGYLAFASSSLVYV